MALGEYLSGDLNEDGTVDGLDLGILLDNWGSTTATAREGDINQDGIVDGLDLGILLGQWGQRFSPYWPEGRLTVKHTQHTPTDDIKDQPYMIFQGFESSENSVWLWDGSNWVERSMSSITYVGPAVSANTNYDLFLIWNVNHVSATRVKWTNDTTRAVTLSEENQLLYDSSDKTKLYVGSARTNGSAKFDDTKQHRHVYNPYNKAVRVWNVSGDKAGNVSTSSHATDDWFQLSDSTQDIQCEALDGLGDTIVANMILTVSCGTGSTDGSPEDGHIGFSKNSSDPVVADTTSVPGISLNSTPTFADFTSMFAITEIANNEDAGIYNLSLYVGMPDNSGVFHTENNTSKNPKITGTIEI